MWRRSLHLIHKQFFTFFIMISTSVLIHCKPEILQTDVVNHPYIQVTNNVNKTGEVDLIVDDVPYEIVDGTYQDPDEQLCEHYGIKYDLVNCMLLA